MTNNLQVTTHKNVQNYYNEKCTYNVNTHWNLLLCTKNIELLKLYSKERTIFFFFLCLIKLLFIKIRCPINVNV